MEADARRDGLDAQALQQRRDKQSKPVLGKIEALLLASLHAVVPGSLLGKALHYMASQWNKLVRFVEDCVFRPIVTARSGSVTGEFGIVTGRSGIVTDEARIREAGCV